MFGPLMFGGIPTQGTAVTTVQSAGKTILVIDSDGKVTSIDPTLHSALGKVIWEHLFASGIEVTTTPGDPGRSPEAYNEAALRVIEALAPHLWPKKT